VVAAAAGIVLLLVLGWLVFGRGDEPAPQATTPSPSPSPTQSSPVQVRVQPSTYVGMPHHDAAERLRALGLGVDTVARSNPGGQDPHTVAAVSPTGLLSPGTLVTMEVWSAPPPPAQPANTNHGQDGTSKKQNGGNGKAGTGHGQGNHGGGQQGRGSGHKGGAR
jgi:serine/threonine-protein kinase